MAKSKGTTGRSLIAMLKRQRAVIENRALKENRDFTDSEQEQLQAIDHAIAHAVPTDRRDAGEQVRVAWEILEVLCDDGTAPPALEVAYAAVRSAKEKLAA
jgi:hypothetical protein